MTCAQADTLCWFLGRQEYVTDAKVYERTADAVICYTGKPRRDDRSAQEASVMRIRMSPENVLASSGRELNSSFREQLITRVILHYGQ